MLAQGPYKTPSSDFSTLFDEVVRGLVAIIETKYTLHPIELASRLTERVIGCSRAGPDIADSLPFSKLTRVAHCVCAIRGLGLSEGEVGSLLTSVAQAVAIDRFSVASLRSSLEDLLFGQVEVLRSKIIQDWSTALFVLEKGDGDPDARLTLFGALMRGFNHLEPPTHLIEDILLGGPLCRLRVSAGENACDFRTEWRSAPFGAAPCETGHTFALSERAELYREIRPLLKSEDDPIKIRRVCRALALPRFVDGAGLKTLLRFPCTEHERRLLILSWASLFERERVDLSLPELSLSDRQSMAKGEKALERCKSVVAAKTEAAVRNGLSAQEDSMRHTRAAYRIAAELCGVDVSRRGAWASIVLSSQSFGQFAVEAPELVFDFIQLIRDRSEDEVRHLMTECDEALYRDALHTHSPHLLLALLPHVSRHGHELPVLCSTIRGYQMEVCGEMRGDRRSGTYNMGLFELDYGPPSRVTVREDLLFAWKFDPRFVDTVSRLWREWYGVEGQENERPEGRASARSELVTFVQRYLLEHQHYYDTYRYLQGDRTKKLSFAFDDSPFPRGPRRDRAYQETFEVMRRNFDLSLRFFTFLDHECKRVPGHAESLFGRFMRQSYKRYSPSSTTPNRAFPGNGWRAGDLRLDDFGITQQNLQKLFRSESSTLSYLNDLNVLTTQGLVAVWCPRCVDTYLDGIPQVWVFFNRHFYPSGNCVGSLVKLSLFERLLEDLESGREFTNARELLNTLGNTKDLSWMGNLSGTLSNAYAFNSGPFKGERYIAESGSVVREPGGHVHKHYLLKGSVAGMGDEFQKGVQKFQNAHHEIYRAYSALHLLFNVGVLYPFSLFKKGYSINSLRPEDHDHLARLDLEDAPDLNPHNLLMMLYAEDVHRAVREGKVHPNEATVVTYEDPLMIGRQIPKIALDCATLQVGTWDGSRWREIDDLTEYDWPQRGQRFMHYFGDAFRSNSLDLKSISRRWIGL
jgi:hypothetical protein